MKEDNYKIDDDLKYTTEVLNAPFSFSKSKGVKNIDIDQAYMYLLNLIEKKDNENLKDFFMHYNIDMQDDEIDHNITVSLNKYLLSNFDEKIIKTFTDNGFSVHLHTLLDQIYSSLEKDAKKLLSFFLENSKMINADPHDPIDIIYEEGILKALSHNNYDYTPILDTIKNIKGEKYIKDLWEREFFQEIFVLNYKKNGYNKLKKHLPENIDWSGFFKPFTDVNNFSQSIFKRKMINIINCLEDIPEFKKSFDDFLSKSRKIQKNFMDIAKNVNETLTINMFPHASPEFNNKYSKMIENLNWKDREALYYMGSIGYFKKNDVYQNASLLPSNLTEIILLSNSPLLRKFLENEKGISKVKKALSNPAILKNWLKRISQNDMIEVLSKIPMDDFKDRHGNNISHYIIFFKPNEKTFDFLIENNPFIFLDKNNINISSFDMIKNAKLLCQSELSILENKIIGSNIKNDNKVFKSAKRKLI